MRPERRRLRVLTWQVHGNYQRALAEVPVQWLLATKPGHPAGYAGRTPSFDWPEHVREVPAGALADVDADIVLFQSRNSWERERPLLAGTRLAKRPSVYLEHDPPQQHPSDTRHWAAPHVDALVHVTPFNALMWDCGAAPVRVIEHAVCMPTGVVTTRHKPRGIVAINHLQRRGRRLGLDVYLRLQSRAPLDLVGMGADALPGGLGEIPNRALPAFMAAYRYYCNPIRWTSLGLSVVEAMHLGLPIVGLATTELVSVVRNGENGYLATDAEALIPVMRELVRDAGLARRWGEAARELARSRFALTRFVADWMAVFDMLAARPAMLSAPSAGTRAAVPGSIARATTDRAAGIIRTPNEEKFR